MLTHQRKVKIRFCFSICICGNCTKLRSTSHNLFPIGIVNIISGKDTKYRPLDCLSGGSVCLKQGNGCLCAGIGNIQYTILVRGVCGIENVFLILVFPVKFHIPSLLWQNIAIFGLFLRHMVFPKRQVNRYRTVLIYRKSSDILTFSGKLCAPACCDFCHKFTLIVPVRSLIVLRYDIFCCRNFKHAAFQKTVLIDKCPIFITCQHFPGFIKFQPAMGFCIRIGYRHNGMGVTILILPTLIVICLAVNCHFNIFFCDVQTAGRIRLINPVRAGFQLLHSHHFTGIIGNKLIDGFLLVSVTIGLLHQFLSLACHLVYFVCRTSL